MAQKAKFTEEQTGTPNKWAAFDANGKGIYVDPPAASSTGSGGFRAFAYAGFNNFQPAQVLLPFKFTSANGFPLFFFMVNNDLYAWEFHGTLGLRRLAAITGLGTSTGNRAPAVGYDTDKNEIWVISAVDTVKIVDVATLTLKETVTITGLPYWENYPNFVYDPVNKCMFYATTKLFKIDTVTRALVGVAAELNTNVTGLYYIAAYGLLFVTRLDNGSYHVVNTTDMTIYTAWSEKVATGLGNTTPQRAARWSDTEFYYAGSHLKFTAAGKPTAITGATPAHYPLHSGIAYNGKLYGAATGGSILKFSNAYVLEDGVAHGAGYYGTSVVAPVFMDYVAETGYIIASHNSHLLFIKP